MLVNNLAFLEKLKVIFINLYIKLNKRLKLSIKPTEINIKIVAIKRLISMVYWVKYIND